MALCFEIIEITASTSTKKKTMYNVMIRPNDVAWELDHVNRDLSFNSLTALPLGLFDPLVALTFLYVCHLAISCFSLSILCLAEPFQSFSSLVLYARQPTQQHSGVFQSRSMSMSKLEVYV